MASILTMHPKVLAASTLKGEKVVSSKGEDLGKIEDYMIDLENGRIAYAVLSFGGFLGMGNKLFMVPWNALTLDTINKRFILDVDKEVLRKAPGFDKNNWPDTTAPEFATRIFTFYHVTPYWEE